MLQVSTGEPENGSEHIQLPRAERGGGGGGVFPSPRLPAGLGRQGRAAAAPQAPPLPRQPAGGRPQAQRLPGVPGRA